MTISNLPYPQEKDRFIEVRFDRAGSSFVILNSSRDKDESGWIIDRLYHCKLVNLDQQMGDFLARTLASYMRDARDRGFEMGREYIRRALDGKAF